MKQYEESKDNWRLANLTDKEQQQIQQLENQLGIALIAYNDMNNVDVNEATKDV